MVLADIKIGVDLIKQIPSMYDYLNKNIRKLSFPKEEELRTIYEQYLKNTLKTYSMAKTLLYSHTPKSIYSFYEPMDLENDSHYISTSDSLKNIDFFQRNKKVIITGTGGIGKSMMLKKIFLDFIQGDTQIPIFLELKKIEDKEDIETFIYKNVKVLGLKLTQEEFLKTLDLGRYIIFFDAFDEINYDISNKIERELLIFSQKYADNIFIISSRPGNSFESWTLFSEYQIAPLTKEKALSLIAKLDSTEHLQNNFYKEIDEKLFETHKQFLSIPLLLTIMLITYQESSEIPNNFTDFYNYCYSALFNRHDASKGYKRKLKTELGESDFKKVLNFVAFRNFTKGQVNMNKDYLVKIIDDYNNLNQRQSSSLWINADDFIDDASNSVCMLVTEGLDYKFSHRSFQEFFGAGYILQKDRTFFENKLLPWIEEVPNIFTDNIIFFNTIQKMAPDILINNILLPIVQKKCAEVEGLSDSELVNTFLESIKLDNDDIFSISYDIKLGSLNDIYKYIHFELNFIPNDIPKRKKTSHLYARIPREKLKDYPDVNIAHVTSEQIEKNLYFGLLFNTIIEPVYGLKEWLNLTIANISDVKDDFY